MTLDILGLLCLASFAAGYVDSIAGGGGMINLPALLMAGIPPHVALGTNKFSNMLGTLNAARIFSHKHVLNPLIFWPGLLTMFIGGPLGVLTAHFISGEALRKLLPLLILCVAVYFISPFSLKEPDPEEKISIKPWYYSAGVGLIMGWYDGFFGPCTGAFLTIWGLLLFRLPLFSSMAFARFFNACSNIGSFLVFAWLDYIDYKIAICMGIANILGNQCGAHSAIRLGKKFIRGCFVVVVVAMAIKLL